MTRLLALLCVFLAIYVTVQYARAWQHVFDVLGQCSP